MNKKINWKQECEKIVDDIAANAPNGLSAEDFSRYFLKLRVLLRINILSAKVMLI